MIEAEKDTSFSTDFKRTNHGAISGVTAPGNTKSIREQSCFSMASVEGSHFHHVVGPSCAARLPHCLQAETHMQGEAYSRMQPMVALHCLNLKSVLGSLKLRSESCKHLQVVGITPIRSWGQVQCSILKCPSSMFPLRGFVHKNCRRMRGLCGV